MSEWQVTDALGPELGLATGGAHAHLAHRPEHIRRRRLHVAQVSHLKKKEAALIHATGEP